MGYAPQRTVLVLNFDEHPGLVVRVRRGSIQDHLDLATFPPDTKDDAYCSPFARNLVSWNVEDEHGRPVPADLDGVLSLEWPFVLELVQAWADNVGAVAAPLEPRSTPGIDPADIPMIALVS